MTGDASPFDLTGIAPAAEWVRAWRTLWQGVPDYLVQPILPGWTFNINSTNSTQPQTELDVVAKHSYGRQIGRISDVLELLIKESQGEKPEKKEYRDFIAMKKEIDRMKKAGAVTRIERMVKDLALLKAKDDKEYARLRDALREALKDS